MKIQLKYTRTLCSFLAIMVFGLSDVNAEQKQFDINLKELRQSPYDISLKELRRGSVRHAKPKRKNRSRISPASDAPAATVTTGENSSYTVRHGDNISLILTGYYGLSQTAAERLIPQVMRMNNLQSTRKLTIGQILLIPLPSPGRAPSVKTVQAEEDTSPKTPQPTPVPPSDDRTTATDIQVHEASPCHLAGEISEKLDWRGATPPVFIQSENVTFSRGERKLVVVCGASPAETYTTERLLARHNTQLLSFEGNEQPRRVTEMILDKLGAPFKQPNGEPGKEPLPTTYIFADTRNPGYDLRLTILPTPVKPEKPPVPQENQPVPQDNQSIPEEKSPLAPEKPTVPQEKPSVPQEKPSITQEKPAY